MLVTKNTDTDGVQIESRGPESMAEKTGTCILYLSLKGVTQRVLPYGDTLS